MRAENTVAREQNGLKWLESAREASWGRHGRGSRFHFRRGVCVVLLEDGADGSFSQGGSSHDRTSEEGDLGRLT